MKSIKFFLINLKFFKAVMQIIYFRIFLLLFLIIIIPFDLIKFVYRPFVTEFLIFWISLSYLFCCFLNKFPIWNLLVFQNKELQEIIFKSFRYLIFLNFFCTFITSSTKIVKNIIAIIPLTLQNEIDTHIWCYNSFELHLMFACIAFFYYLLNVIDLLPVYSENYFNLFFNGDIINNFYTMYIKFFLLILIYISLKHWIKFINSNNFIWKLTNDFLFIFLGSSLFLMILCSVNNLYLAILIIIGMSINFYVLLAVNCKFGEIPREATAKYFILSALSSALFLGGMKELFLITGTLNFNTLNDFFILIITDNSAISQLFAIKYAILFIFGSFLFKLSAAPSHFWAPEVYEGLPFSLISFIILPIKFAIGFLFLRIFKSIFTVFAFSNYDNFMILNEIEIFLIITILLSMIIGGINALFEQNLKRFIAYSSINQIGFLFLGLLGFTSSLQAIQAFIYFLCVHVINLTFFIGIIVYFLEYNYFQIINETKNEKPESVLVKNKKQLEEHIIFLSFNLVYITDLQKIFNSTFYGFKNQNKFFFFSHSYYTNLFVLLLILVLFSLAGIPPLLGFFGKFYILLYVLKMKYYSILAIAILISIISIYYYLKLLKIIIFEKPYFIDNCRSIAFTSNKQKYNNIFALVICLSIFFSPMFLDNFFLAECFKITQSFILFLN